MKKKTSRGSAAAGSRPAKVGELLRQELSSMFQDGWVRDPRFSAAFVTVTGVDMSADLAHGTVHVSVFSEDPAQIEGVMYALADARRDLRRELGRRLSMRHTPELHFASDTSAAYGEKMERLLKQIRTDAPPAETIPGGDTDPGHAAQAPDADDGPEEGGDEITNPDADTPVEPSDPEDPDGSGAEPTQPDGQR